MRPGPLEVILIIVVIIAAAVIARIVRGSRINSKKKQDSLGDTTARAPQSQTTGPHHYIRRTGIAFILSGIVLFLAGISMFRWAFQSYLWAFIIIAVGSVILFLSRKKG